MENVGVMIRLEKLSKGVNVLDLIVPVYDPA